jgi:hypothetical protein
MVVTWVTGESGRAHTNTHGRSAGPARTSRQSSAALAVSLAPMRPVKDMATTLSSMRRPRWCKTARTGAQSGGSGSCPERTRLSSASAVLSSTSTGRKYEAGTAEACVWGPGGGCGEGWMAKAGGWCHHDNHGV